MSTNPYKEASCIKAGVVGYGGAFNMGRQHLQQMQATGMIPTAVAEVDPDRLRVAGEDFPGIETYSSVKEMLEKSGVNLVVLITPHNTHAPLALQCLEAGRHVVCEKPLAITTAEVDAMMAAAARSGLMLSTYHNRHWDGRILQAVELIRNQKIIGEIVRIECHMNWYGKPRDWWRSSRSISGGILYDWGVHLLEYALQLLDGRMIEVSGYAHEGYWATQSKWGSDTNEDEAFAVVRFDDRTWLTLSLSHVDSKGKEGMLEITGTRGTYLMEGATSRIFQHTEQGEIITKRANPADEGHKYYENVRDHLVHGERLVITPELSRRPIHILDLASQSARLGKAMPTLYP